MNMLDRVADHIRATLTHQSLVRIAFPGGRSAINLMSGLSQLDLDWSSIEVTLVDERAVDCTDAASNAKLVSDTLLINQAARARFRPLYDGVSVNTSVATLRAQGDCLDVAILGLGEDGHFASLFPAATPVPGLIDDDHGYVSTPPLGSPCVPRISMTLPKVLSASLVVLLVSSEQKRAKVLEGMTHRDPQNPVSYLLGAPHPVWVEWPDQTVSLIEQGGIQ